MRIRISDSLNRRAGASEFQKLLWFAGIRFDKPNDGGFRARDEAEACWNRILTLKRPERFSSVDVGIYGHLTRRNLARIAEEKGDLRTARRLWEEIIEECPNDGEAITALCGSIA